MTVRHIVFDIGGVLIHWDPELAYLEAIPDETERRWFLDNVCTPAWNLEQDRGRSWADAEAELIARHPDHERMIRHYRANWHSMVPHAHEGTVAILHRLIDAGHDVTMLTNFAADTFEEASQRFDFLQRPRAVTVSGRIGKLKPDEAIYRRHEADHGVSAEHAFFIDDSAKNVEGARQAGWRAVQFIDADKLARDLEELGIAF